MALKRKIDKKAFEKLPADIQAEYTAEGDEYILDVEGIEDTGALTRANARLKTDNADLKTKLEGQTEELETLRTTRSDKDKDIDKIEKAHKAKVDKLTADGTEALKKRDGFIEKLLRDSVAEKIAGEISTVPTLMSKALRERITVDFEGDEPTTRILGKDGKVSDMTPEQLKKEFLQNPEYKGILVGSRATGGRAPQDAPRTANGLPPSNDQSKSLLEIPAKDHLAAIRARKEQAGT